MGVGQSSETEPQFVVHGRLYRILNVIGEGSEAMVYRCEDQTGENFAVKLFDFSAFRTNEISQAVSRFHREAQMLKHLSRRSPHFIYLYDFEYRPEEKIGYMLMELGEGSLRDYLQGLPLQKSLRQNFWKQIVAILKALEDSQIVHADIKPDNLIIVNNTLKVTDLSLAFRLSSNRQSIQRNDVEGTLDYMAPEVFSYQTGFKSDIWSAGIILYEMTYGFPPYSQIFDRNEKISAISSRIPICFAAVRDPRLLDCLERCLKFECHHRPSPQQLFTHPYVGYR